MGSLPNLTQLDPDRCYIEKERQMPNQRLRDIEQNAHNLFRDPERFPVFVHPIQIAKSNLQQHRHSFAGRKVLRTRSSGTTQYIWDDPMIEHMVTYSPISSQSHRTGPLSNHIHQHLSNNRRRESMNSSIGATSVRRLLAVNRGSRHRIPTHIRSKILKDFTFLSIAHGLCWAILIPIFGMQGARTIWFHKENIIDLGADIGTVLLSLSFLITSGMCLLTTKLVKKFGFMTLFIAKYSGLCLFLAVHLYPTIYVLLPGYIIFGLTFGPALIAKLSIIVSIPCKLSCYQQELSAVELFDENKITWKRDESICKFARWFHAAQNFGIVCGATIAAVILTMSSSSSSQTSSSISSTPFLNPLPSTTPMSKFASTFSITSNLSDIQISKNISTLDISQQNQALSTFRSQILSDLLIKAAATASPLNHTSTETSFFPDIETMIHQMEYYSDEPIENSVMDQKLCGIHFCPGWDLTTICQPPLNDYNVEKNETQAINGNNLILTVTNFGQIELLGVFLGMSIIALLLICLIGTIENNMRVESLRCLSDTVIFAGPMAYFIGTEQGYMLADYTTAFVSCSLGPDMIAGSLIGMGIMQFIASMTLSMLLRHTKRIVVIVAGFFFHACLLLVLSRWKPSEDDSALFYVITAAWGVCNSVWETLCFALVTLTHTNNVMDVMSPLQCLRFLGLGITFAAHGLLCEGPKILILAILLVICVPPYALYEIRLESQRKANKINL